MTLVAEAANEVGTRQDPHVQARSARQQPLLLHSMALFREVLAVVFEHRPIRTVVEVGVETGQVSACYAELGAEAVHCVEPAPTEQLRRTLAEHDALHLVEGRSPDVLPEIPIADLYVLDGDHNYAAVRAELDWILVNAPDAVVVLHDVLWPCSRRDLYYLPRSPGDQHHESSDDGPTIWHDDLTPSGFVGAGQFTFATTAGGERNGVLTATEDAIAEHGGRLEIVPAVFGLGVLLREGSEADQLIGEALSPYTGSALLSAMENNRLALYTRVLAMQAEAVAHADEADRQVRELQDRNAEVAELRSRCDELIRRHAEELDALRNRNEELGRQLDRERVPKPVREVVRIARRAKRSLSRRA
ncbi:class I SAM-dependent methyltransferase [Saccharopolyspora griseoalba]|uniref:Class I SAM-dependent methyltransferase n=1 Tax=Saccharopolyspora griseoalba TaxID=1431848 RepID=A0ABW2LLK7_9PSEU